MSTDEEVTVIMHGPRGPIRITFPAEFLTVVYEAEFVNMVVGGPWEFWHEVELEEQ